MAQSQEIDHLFDLLDNECVIKIFQYLHYWDARILRQCSRRFREIWRALPWRDPVAVAFDAIKFIDDQFALTIAMSVDEQVRSLTIIRNANAFIRAYKQWINCTFNRVPKYMTIEHIQNTVQLSRKNDMSFVYRYRISEARICARTILRDNARETSPTFAPKWREQYAHILSIAFNISDQLRELERNGTCDLAILESCEHKKLSSVVIEERDPFCLRCEIRKEIERAIGRYARADWIVQWPTQMILRDWARPSMYKCRSPKEMCAAICEYIDDYSWQDHLYQLCAQHYGENIPIFRFMSEQMITLALSNPDQKCLPMCGIITSLYRDHLISRNDAVIFGQRVLAGLPRTPTREIFAAQLCCVDRTIAADLSYKWHEITDPVLLRRKHEIQYNTIASHYDDIAEQELQQMPITFFNMYCILDAILSGSVLPQYNSATDMHQRIRVIVHYFAPIIDNMTAANRAQLRALFSRPNVAPHIAQYIAQVIGI